MRLLAAAAAVLLLAVPALAETNVGVTAAVNQSASGTTGSNVRTISLGDSVIYNERIQTGGDGLVQILLADGTTFMVGPNSDLVIDSFVYDPNAGTAQVTASFTKGVLRFIGGQTSKTEGGVTLNTPVGTMGIRGAMVDVVLDPPAGTPQHIDMLFGNEVTLEQGQQLLGRLYAAGYSLVLGEGGAFEVLKTPPGWGSQIQAALAGKPGTKGGAPKGPTEDEVGKSEFAENNQPDDPPGLSESELKALLEAAAHYDELRNFILNNQTPQGFVGGVLVAVGDGDTVYPVMNEVDPNTFAPSFIEMAFDADGNPVRIEVPIGVPSEICGTETGCLVYEGGPDGGEVVADVGDDDVSFPVTNPYLYGHDNVPDPELAAQLASEIQCTDCDEFIRWGFWGFDAENFPFGEGTVDASVDALWVTGDLTTAAQLGNLAALSESGGIGAYYAGDAVGNVYNNGETYVATGDLTMGWNFADREGWISIYAFDDSVNLGGIIESQDGQTGFVGNLWVGDSADPSGFASGAFVNDGSTAAGGVIGNFGFSLGPDYTASGVFFGQQDTPL